MGLALAAAARIEKAAFTRADLVEAIGAVLPLTIEGAPGTARTQIETLADRVGMRITAGREAHQREGSERFTLAAFLAEEQAVLDVVDARGDRAVFGVNTRHTAGLSPDQVRAVTAIAGSPWLVCPLSAPAGAGKTTSLRALCGGARYQARRVVVLAPTGQAVDVAMREGAGDVGYTVAQALLDLRNGREKTGRRAGSLWLDGRTVVIVDEAGMVGTDQLRELLAATAAGCKTVLVGDAHQLAPVKARGGMFAQLCDDLPWTQRLSEVWRMRDTEERQASLAVRDGGPAPVRRAVGWYRSHDRLHTGDPVAMAADALDAYQADVAAGKDSLLIADTLEVCDALNRRLHDQTIDADAPSVIGARGHRIATGDVIISRRNNPTVAVFAAGKGKQKARDPVRNGNRWQVIAVDPEHDQIAARRLGDRDVAVFTGEYLHAHVTHGYATTVHSAQGVTADTTHAVLGEKTSRNVLYVAMTRGKESNTAYLYEKIGGEGEHEHGDPEPGVHVLRRGSSHQAAVLVRGIIGNRDDRAQTAHQVAADTAREQLLEQVAGLLDRRTRAVAARRTAYRHWNHDIAEQLLARRHFLAEHLSRDRGQEQSVDDGLEL